MTAAAIAFGTAFDANEVIELDQYFTAEERRALDALLPEVESDIVDHPEALGLLPPEPHVEYRHRPIDWAVEKLGVPRHTLVWSENDGYEGHEWDGTQDPIAAMMTALAENFNVAVEAGTGTQKSYTAAILILFFLACWEGARVFTFAPKEDQLRLYIWTEITKLWPRFSLMFPTASLGDLRLRMYGGRDDSWAAIGYACAVRAGEEVASKAQGMHAAHMLIVTEETPGIHPAVVAAHENTCTADHNLRMALGNPEHQLDTLHQLATSPGFVPIRISALDAPNVVTGREVIPGAASRKSVERRLSKYGADDPVYLSRVRGISPAQAAEAIIRLEWLEHAARLFDELNMSHVAILAPAIGVDVAQSTSGDHAAIARGRGNVLMEVESKVCPNATVLGREVAAEAKVYNVASRNIGMDPVGVGAATLNELRELCGPEVQALWGNATPYTGDQKGPDGETYEWVPDGNVFYNLRAQMYWQLREDLRFGRVPMKRNVDLFRQLTTPKSRKKLGKVLIEEKEEIRKRLGFSPDDADAVAYWNWVRPRADEYGHVRGTPVHPNQDPRAVPGHPMSRADAGSGVFAEMPAENNWRGGEFAPSRGSSDGTGWGAGVGVDELGPGY